MTAADDEMACLYQLERPLGARPYWYIAGGVLAVLVAVLLFVVNVFTPPGKGLPFPVFIGTTVIPIMLGGAAIAYAFHLLRCPSQVQLDREGIALEGPMIRRQIAWSEIGRVETDKKEWPWLQREFRALVLYGTAGRKLATLTELIGDFDDLVAQVSARVEEATGAGVGDARLRKSKRNAVLFCVAGVAFFCLCVFVGIDAWRTKTNLRLLETEGVEVDATIKRHYIYNVTPRIEYAFATTDGAPFNRNASMDRSAWDRLQGAKTVRVRYVPANPDFSRLMEGEVEDMEMNPNVGLVFSGIGIALSVFFIVAGVFLWLNREIDLDSKSGKIRILKLGEKRGSGAASSSGHEERQS
jgi:hypothetical protein